MPKLFGLYRFPNTSAADAYTTDDGRAFNLINRFVVPPDIDAAGAADIIASIPGAVVRLSGEPGICPLDSVEPRKITYFRSNGSSLSLVAPVRPGTNIQTQIDANVAAIETAGDFPVVCAALEGEVLKDMYDVYVPGAKVLAAAAVGNRPPAAAGIQYYYTGTMPYQTDYTPFASVRITPFKIASDLAANAVPTLWAGTIAAAPFSLVASDLPACSANDYREPRHFIVTNAIGATLAAALPQQTKIPVSVATEVAIAGAATTLATLGSTFCLEYKGESNSRLWRS